MKKSSEIQKKINHLRKNKQIIGLCHGVFDLLHHGHLLHFEAAKKKCDYLFVSITSDEYIEKGPNRPIHSNNERINILKSLKFVDHAFIAKGKSAVDSINLIKPNFYFKGNEYKDNLSDKTKKIFQEIDAVKKNKGTIFYTNEKEMSSSKIINQLGLALNEKQIKFLEKVKKQYNYNNIINSLIKLKNDKVLVVGDLIIDQYSYTSFIGGQTKTPTPSVLLNEEKKYVGGAGIVAKHLKKSGANVELTSIVGNDDNFKFAKKKLTE